MSMLCERCSYDEADEKTDVPDIFQDRYLALCKTCCDELHMKQAKMEGA